MPAAVSPIARPSVGRTFIVAISVLGVIALGQIGAVAWMFAARFTTLTERAKLGPARLVATDTTAATPAPGDLVATATLDAHDPFEIEQRQPEASSEPIVPPPKPAPVSSAKLNPQAPPETRYEEMVLTGKQLRERGDTAAALVKLREAMAFEPENPEAIAELAVTFERMSLMDKAAEQWKRIYDMGAAAGSFFIAAESRMKMSQAQAIAAAATVQPVDTPVSRLRADATLGIGDIVRQDKRESGGTRFTLRVPVRAKRGEAIAVGDVDIKVLFFDLVDDKTPVQTSADLSYRFASAPIDWATGDPETLEVEFSAQPPLKTGPRSEKREYHGYIVQVYYKGQLQDLRAEPESLNTKFPAPQTLENHPPAKK